MKTYSGVIVLLSTLLCVPTTWAVETDPDTLVKNTAQEVLTIIRQDKDIKSGNKTKLYNLIEKKVLPHFNFSRMTKLAMGKNWHKAEPQQQRELIEQFRTLLVRTYYKALSVYSDHTIKVTQLKDIAGKRHVTVSTQVIKNHEQPVSINYGMLKTKEGWKVYDITVAGISLVISYRSSFNSQIRKSGIEGLLKTLAEKNRSLKVKDKKKSTMLVKKQSMTL